MPPDVVRWAFFSPVRLVLVCLTAGAVVVGAALLATGGSPHDNPPARSAEAASRSRPSPGTAPETAPSESVSPRARRQAARAAREFVEVWSSGRSMASTRWHRALKPRTTASLYRGLRSTEPARLPRGHVSGAHVEQLGPFAGTALVTLTGNVVLEVQLVTEHGRWIASDVQPAGA